MEDGGGVLGLEDGGGVLGLEDGDGVLGLEERRWRCCASRWGCKRMMSRHRLK